MLARELGDAHSFTLGSPLKPGFVQEFRKFSDAAAQAMEARIWGGIHIEPDEGVVPNEKLLEVGPVRHFAREPKIRDLA